MRLAAALATSAALLLAVSCFVVLSGRGDDGGAGGADKVKSELLSRDGDAGARAIGLWEADDSVAHNPYYNIFDGDANERVVADGHRDWSMDQIRDRVWQTLKDVKAMERHVAQQNALNKRLHDEIYDMTRAGEKEKEVIRLLIDEGMKGVVNKIQLLKQAVDANVTGVQEALRSLDNSLYQKQMQQDRAITDLEDKHAMLVNTTRQRIVEVGNRIDQAEADLKAAEGRVGEEREKVKAMILERIQKDIGDLDKEMDSKFSTARDTLERGITNDIQDVERNVSDFSLASGVRLAKLINRVSVLDDRQKGNAQRQDALMTDLENQHEDLRNTTLHSLETLRKEIEENRLKLSDAEKMLQQEEASRKELVKSSLAEGLKKLNISHNAGDVISKMAIEAPPALASKSTWLS